MKSKMLTPKPFLVAVAPYAGAWIEIFSSFPGFPEHFVAPYAGAWIEILSSVSVSSVSSVAPYAGAWIEIPASANSANVLLSLPTRERGLKSV